MDAPQNRHYKRLVPPPQPLALVVDPDDPSRVAKVENVVVSYRIVKAHDGRRVHFNLEAVAEGARAQYPCFYNPSKLRALKFRFCLDHPATQPTALLFSTGQVNQAGEQVPEKALRMAHMLAMVLTRVTGVHLTVSNYKITNMVAHTRIPSEIDLRYLVLAVGEQRVNFDDTQKKSAQPTPPRPFSAARVDPLSVPNMKFSFFRSGAVVMPGAKMTPQFVLAMREVFEIYEIIMERTNTPEKRAAAQHEIKTIFERRHHEAWHAFNETLISGDVELQVLADANFARAQRLLYEINQPYDD